MKKIFLLLAFIGCISPIGAVQKQTYTFAQRDTCSLKMDVYMPDDTLSSHPCVFFVFGGGFKICPPAKENDGLMDVIVVDHIKGVFKIVKAFIELMGGRIIE